MEKIIDILQQSGDYNFEQANLVALELQNINNDLKPILESWIEDQTDIKDYEIGGTSIVMLMKEKKLLFPAALLTIDWIIKEPNIALKVVRNS